MKKLREFLISLFVCNSLHKIALAQDASFALDGGTQYVIAWMTRDELTMATETKSDEPTQLLPNMLLEEGHWTEEVMMIKTAGNEAYTCLLPSPVIDTSNEDKSGEEAPELTPEYLLRPLQHQCTRLLMGYWNYELCHGDYLRQYHEEKLEDGQVKVDEYILGTDNDDLTDTSTQTPSSQDEAKIPVWPVHGREYPYYSVEMGGGTPCDIKDGIPRGVVIRYICDREAYKYGSLLRVDESTSCKYEALVSTPQLCQNSLYRLHENIIQSIKCFPQEDSPRRPKALFEHEMLSAGFKDTSIKATTTELLGSEVSEGAQSESKANQKGKSVKRVGSSKVFELDKGYIISFLNGEMCLRGGAGWWLHEVCYGQHVKQVHVEQTGERTEVLLGVWDKDAHQKWFKKSGSKKLSRVQVVHLYRGGDSCDVTGTPRQCQVKYRCIKTAKSSQISLYLEEPATCSYTLTVEGAFVCTLLDHLDEHGVFDKASFEATDDKIEILKSEVNDELIVSETVKNEVEENKDEIAEDSGSQEKPIDGQKGQRN